MKLQRHRFLRQMAARPRLFIATAIAIATGVPTAVYRRVTVLTGT